MNQHSLRILIIDSSLLSVRLLKQGLEGQGLDVAAVPSKEQAAELLQASPCDVIVAEVTEDRTCGIYIAEVLQSRGLSIPLIALAVADSPSLRSVAEEFQARGFLSKPTSVEDVRQAIDEAMRGSAPSATPVGRPARSPTPGSPAPEDTSDMVASLRRTQEARESRGGPRVRSERESGGEKSRPSGPPKRTHTPRVLLVDDDPLVRKFLRVVLEQIGIEIFEAKGAFEAWKIVHKKKVDLVVTDLKMEGHTGLDLLRNMRLQKIKVPSIVLTGHATPENIQKARKYGALTVIEKSADITPVKDTVTQVLSNLGFSLDVAGAAG